MAKNKQQLAAEQRAKAHTQPAVGTNPGQIDGNTGKVNEEPKPVVEQPKATPATPAPAAAISKQQQTVLLLTAELKRERGIEIKPEMLQADGKFIILRVGEGWPTMRVGVNGGVVLMEVRSYKEGIQSWLHADELLQKQIARDQKKVAASQPAAPPAAKTPEVAPTPKETVTSRKQKQDAELEKQLAG